MSQKFAEIAFTPRVKEQQERHGSRRQYDRMQKQGASQDVFGANERHFIATRDSFYMATVSETGWPYVQFRGGPPGFLKVLDEHTLGFADFRGNRQYISAGNLAANDRVAMILMDYPSQSRLKILGHIEVLEGEEASGPIEKLRVPGYKAVIERAILIHLEAFDWNCPQHITPRFTKEEIEAAVEPLRDRLTELEQENERLRQLVGDAALPSSS